MGWEEKHLKLTEQFLTERNRKDFESKQTVAMNRTQSSAAVYGSSV